MKKPHCGKVRQVKCIDCGSLGMYPGHSELKPIPRHETLSKPVYKVSCILNRWSNEDKRSIDTMHDASLKKRGCRYFIKYQSGYSPQEHKTLQRDIENRNTMIKATLMGAGVGAAAAILSNFILNN